LLPGFVYLQSPLSQLQRFSLIRRNLVTTSKQSTLHPLLKASQIAALPEQEFVHKLNPQAVRHTRSLGDLTGLSSLGVHLVRLLPGKQSTEFHFHVHDEEWVYILSGRGMAEIGSERVEVGAGDFMGFVAGSLPHAMANPFGDELVYLVGGNRLPFDICEYPRLRKRRYRVNGKNEFVDWDGTEKPGEN
jgi:uncharacterized cupin superfamily protein